jgi:hypothetical protein
VVSAGTSLWLAGVQNKSTFQMELHVNSTSVAGFTSVGGFNTTFGSGPIVHFGCPSFDVGFNPAAAHEYGLIYNRPLAANELGWLLTNGRDLFARKRDWAGWTAALGAAAVSGVSVSPAGLRITNALGVAAVMGAAAIAPSGLPITNSLGTVTETTGTTIAPAGLVIIEGLGLATAAPAAGVGVAPAGLVITVGVGRASTGKPLVTPAGGFFSVLTPADSFFAPHVSNRVGADSFQGPHVSEQVVRIDSFAGPHTSVQPTAADSFHGPHVSVARAI